MDKNDKNSKLDHNKMWGGRFSSSPDVLMHKINSSIDFDKYLFSQDIRGSKAHAAMLLKCGIISSEDEESIQSGLDSILKEIETDKFVFNGALEDIHMNVEARLAELIGDAAGRLHTARSRNDQVATDFRLWVREAIDNLDAELELLHSVIIDLAEQHTDTIMPGFTHLQTAQPVTLGHHMLAYVEMIGRDRGRLDDCRLRLNECPLGAAALAGTSFPIDRSMTADELGFERPMANSLDAVSDRDFALEFLSSASILSVHLSRFAEELVIWASDPFSFIRISDEFSTGSSIMPQKRNPDAAELVRAKVGRIIGSLNTLLIVMKGLPLAYCKDMQEDKEPVFDAVESLALCITVIRGMLQTLTVKTERMGFLADSNFSTATDLADWLVRVLKMPFRSAHKVTGELVKLAEVKNVNLPELSLEEMRSVEKQITNDVYNVLSVENSIRSRSSFGGTSPKNVRISVAKARNRFLKGVVDD